MRYPCRTTRGGWGEERTLLNPSTLRNPSTLLNPAACFRKPWCQVADDCGTRSPTFPKSMHTFLQPGPQARPLFHTHAHTHTALSLFFTLSQTHTLPSLSLSHTHTRDRLDRATDSRGGDTRQRQRQRRYTDRQGQRQHQTERGRLCKAIGWIRGLGPTLSQLGAWRVLLAPPTVGNTVGT